MLIKRFEILTVTLFDILCEKVLWLKPFSWKAADCNLCVNSIRNLQLMGVCRLQVMVYACTVTA